MTGICYGQEQSTCDTVYAELKSYFDLLPACRILIIPVWMWIVCNSSGDILSKKKQFFRSIRKRCRIEQIKLLNQVFLLVLYLFYYSIGHLFFFPAKSTVVFSIDLHYFSLSWPWGVPGGRHIFHLHEFGNLKEATLQSLHWWYCWHCYYLTFLCNIPSYNIPLYWPNSLL